MIPAFIRMRQVNEPFLRVFETSLTAAGRQAGQNRWFQLSPR